MSKKNRRKNKMEGNVNVNPTPVSGVAENLPDGENKIGILDKVKGVVSKPVNWAKQHKAASAGILLTLVGGGSYLLGKSRADDDDDLDDDEDEDEDDDLDDPEEDDEA